MLHDSHISSSVCGRCQALITVATSMPPLAEPGLQLQHSNPSLLPVADGQSSQLTCEMQVKCDKVRFMGLKKTAPNRRSGCPLNASVEILGDRWSLLIIRDMMLRGFRTYKEFLGSYEGIATNILADRLRKLDAYGIIRAKPDPSDGRKLFYVLTPKGMDLAPVLTEMVLWAAAHENTENQALVRQIKKDKKQFLRAVRHRSALTR